MNCEYCNKPIEEGHRPNKKFCNDKCRVYEIKFKKGLKPNPFEDKHIKYNSPDIIKLRKEIEKKLYAEAKVGEMARYLHYCIGMGHYSKIKQEEINFLFTGKFDNEVFINLNF